MSRRTEVQVGLPVLVALAILVWGVTWLKEFFFMKDLYSGLLKAMFFGGIIGTMGCHYGFATEGGAEGVGQATTRAVVGACVLVLISDYVLANVLFRFIFAE